MTTIVTKKRSLLKETEQKLNEQIQMEGLASFYYLAMASWAETQGYLGASEFLYDHAEEERTHMLKIMKYVNDAGGYAKAPEITDIRHDYTSLKEVFESILEHELAVTRSINKLSEFCFEVKDFATFNFLQWFVNEQREEEATSRRNLEFFDIIGEEGQGLWMIDAEIRNLLKEIKKGN